MGTELAKKYGLGYKPADKVFLDSYGSNIRKAFNLCEVWEYKVKKPQNRFIVETMFCYTAEWYNFGTLGQLKKELLIDLGLRDLVLQIDQIVAKLQAASTAINL
jgi:hypothetical protein